MAVSSALFGQWQVSPHLPYNGPLHHYPSSAWKVPLFSLLYPSLLTPSASPLCCWCNIMSVGEGMACLCAPEGLPTHCWEEKTTWAWMPLSPSLFKHPFTPTTTTMVLGLCGTALFLSLAHPQTHKERWWQQRLGGGGLGVSLCFLPSYACSVGLIGHMGSKCNWISSEPSFLPSSPPLYSSPFFSKM